MTLIDTNEEIHGRSRRGLVGVLIWLLIG